MLSCALVTNVGETQTQHKVKPMANKRKQLECAVLTIEGFIGGCCANLRLKFEHWALKIDIHFDLETVDYLQKFIFFTSSFDYMFLTESVY